MDLKKFVNFCEYGPNIVIDEENKVLKHWHQEAEEEGQSAAIIHYRDDETMYVEAKADRVTVVFSTLFKDEDDVVLGKVFLQVWHFALHFYGAWSFCLLVWVPPTKLSTQFAKYWESVNEWNNQPIGPPFPQISRLDCFASLLFRQKLSRKLPTRKYDFIQSLGF